MCSTRASGGARRRVIWSGLSAASNEPHPALPVEEGAGLLGDRGDRQDDVGVLGDLAGPQLQRHHEADRVQRLTRARRVGQVGDLDARRPPARRSSPAGGGLDDLAGVAAVAVRELGHAPDRRRPPRARAGRCAGRPPGSSDGSAPASTAPRSPARRGIHTSWAPVAAAARTAAVSPPGTAASRSPTTITAPSARSASAACSPVARPDRRRPRARPATRSRCRARRAAACRPPSPGRGWRAWRARRSAARACGRPCAAAGRRRAPPPRPRTRPAGPPGAFSSAVYVTPVPSRSRPRPATWAARKSASSALCTRARKSMSLVSRATRANLAYA